MTDTTTTFRKLLGADKHLRVQQDNDHGSIKLDARIHTSLDLAVIVGDGYIKLDVQELSELIEHLEDIRETLTQRIAEKERKTFSQQFAELGLDEEFAIHGANRLGWYRKLNWTQFMGTVSRKVIDVDNILSTATISTKEV